MSISKFPEVIQAWVQVAQNSVLLVGPGNVSGNHAFAIGVQAFLDTETAHAGTEFIIQGSLQESGFDNWNDYKRIYPAGLVGMANEEAITNNPLVKWDTSITVASTTGYTGIIDVALPQRAIKDGVNSEIVIQTAYTTNTNITILGGSAFSHVATTKMYSLAVTFIEPIPVEYLRVRVIINNKYDSDGSSLMARVTLGRVQIVGE